MSTISAFVFTSLNGYYKGPDEDISWHHHGEEELKFSEESVSKGNTLLFGRVTFEHMKAFWPTPAAAQNMPKIAKGMNNSEKLVMSRTLRESDWQNTNFLSSDWVQELAEIKKHTDITLLGSGSILTQLATENLLDELQLMIDPRAIGAGSTIFKGLTRPLNFQLKDHRIFNTGNVLLTYSR